MRWLAVLILTGLAACGGEKGGGGAAAPAPRPLLRLDAYPVPSETQVVVDGTSGDPVWRRARELAVPLTGGGVASVRIRAAHDGRQIFLLVTWDDPQRSWNRYWIYRGQRRWEPRDGEDAFSICWSPGSLADDFREQGCALFCHDGRHVYPGAESGVADFWYWGAQQTASHAQARDMALRFGEKQRLRGDAQPAESDNLINLRPGYGPKYVPMRIQGALTRRILLASNVQELPEDAIGKQLDEKNNIGWEVPREILRPRKGSRGDVAAHARHYDGKRWVLEFGRHLDTGHRDDQPLRVDPDIPFYFSVAVQDGTPAREHATSGPIALHLLAPR